LCALGLVLQLPHARSQDPALFSQSASAALNRQFGSSNLSWILLDRSGRTLAQNWPEPDTSIPPGSLLKPFIALAYGQQNNFAFPHVHCAGTKDRCWLPRGHGAPGLEDALAQSCNAYFLSLAARLDAVRATAVFTRLGLAGPPRDATPATLIGLSSAWRETPLALAHAFLALVNDDQPTPNRVALGMRMAARTGTASALDSALGAGAVLAKTGTAACTHHPRAAADGYSVALYPAGQPRVLLLLRMHGATGAQTSKRAAAMLRALGIGTP
jgi:cell division protein FtsI/penicillin-binding protein 2